MDAENKYDTKGWLFSQFSIGRLSTTFLDPDASTAMEMKNAPAIVNHPGIS